MAHAKDFCYVTTRMSSPTASARLRTIKLDKSPSRDSGLQGTLIVDPKFKSNSI